MKYSLGRLLPGRSEGLIKHGNSKGFSGIVRALTVFSFLLPGLAFYILFMLFPIFDTVHISFTNWNGVQSAFNYIGFQNYTKLLSNKLFWNSVSNTLFWVVAQLALIVLPTLLLAGAIVRSKRSMSFFRTVFYLPSIISFSVAAIIWAKIYDPTIGPVNIALRFLGLADWAQNWLGNQYTVLPALVIASSWVQYGLYLVLYIAGLQSIDEHLYEAAEIDGAGRMQKFWKITVPSLQNTMNVVISLVIINAFKGFSMVWITTQGGPMYKSDLVTTFMYREAFTSYKIGLGTAGGVLLAAAILIVTFVFNFIRERGNRI